MPYMVKHNVPGCPASRPWAVFGPTGKKHGCHPSKARADRQARALYANDPNVAARDQFTEALSGSETRVLAFEQSLARRPAVAAEEAAAVMLELATSSPTAPAPVAWEGILGFEGLEVEDSTELPRFFPRDTLSWRDVPLPLMAQTVTAEGHGGAVLAGRIDAIWREPWDEDPEVVAIWGAGDFTTAVGINEIAPRVADGTLTGVSMDLVAARWHVIDRETLAPIAEEDMQQAMFDGKHYAATKSAKIAAATLVTMQGMAPAKMALTAAAAGEATVTTTTAIALVSDADEVLTAAALGLAPLEPPRDWFFMPEPDELTALTVTDEGQVYGHLAPWGECHRSFQNACVLAPRSRTGYAEFHLGAVPTAEGEMVPAGRLTVNIPHAPQTRGYPVAKVRAHYDNASAVAAFVRASDGQHGIWMCGAVRSDASPELVRDMIANCPSGDWRGSELQAALCVPVPGFPVRRATLVASAAGEEVESLIIAWDGPDDCGCDGDVADFDRKLAALAAAADGGLAALIA